MATLAIIIVAAVVVLQGPALSRKLAEKPQSGRMTLARGKTGKVSVTAGRIPLADFLKFLSSLTGLPVLHDSTDPYLITREISIATDIEEADEDIIKVILEVNRIRVYREALPGGKEILKVEVISRATRPPPAPTYAPPFGTS